MALPVAEVVEQLLAGRPVELPLGTVQGHDDEAGVGRMMHLDPARIGSLRTSPAEDRCRGDSGDEGVDTCGRPTAGAFHERLLSAGAAWPGVVTMIGRGLAADQSHVCRTLFA